MSEFEFTSRYGDGPLPDPDTMCPGQCEGLGFYPQTWLDPSATREEIHAWYDCHLRGHGFLAFWRILWQTRALRFAWQEATRCDGYHFIKCPTCGGTGKASR